MTQWGKNKNSFWCVKSEFMHLKMKLCKSGYKSHEDCLFMDIDNHSYLLSPCCAYSTLVGHVFLIYLNLWAGNIEFLRLQKCDPWKQGSQRKAGQFQWVSTFTINFRVEVTFELFNRISFSQWEILFYTLSLFCRQ